MLEHPLPFANSVSKVPTRSWTTSWHWWTTCHTIMRPSHNGFQWSHLSFIEWFATVCSYYPEMTWRFLVAFHPTCNYRSSNQNLSTFMYLLQYVYIYTYTYLSYLIQRYTRRYLHYTGIGHLTHHCMDPYEIQDFVECLPGASGRTLGHLLRARSQRTDLWKRSFVSQTVAGWSYRRWRTHHMLLDTFQKLQAWIKLATDAETS